MPCHMAYCMSPVSLDSRQKVPSWEAGAYLQFDGVRLRSIREYEPIRIDGLIARR